MSLASKVVDSFRSRGLVPTLNHAIERAYSDHIHALLPATAEPALYSGYLSPFDKKIFDRRMPTSFIPDEYTDQPLYEAALLGGLRKHVRRTDTVVIVGGGYGITALVASQLARSVTVFEGSLRNVPLIETTFHRNGASMANVTIRAAVVGTPISVWGDMAPTILDPGALPACDVLELDCEGAEAEILEGMSIRPRICLVETHGTLGAPTSRTRQLLSDLGYAVRGLGVAEPGKADYCVSRDIYVLEAIRPV